MGLRTGGSSPSEGPASLRAAPGVDADAPTDTREDPGDVEDVREDLALLLDAATLMTARQRLGGLLLQLAVNAFDPAAYRGLRSHLAGPGVLALAAYDGVNALTARGI